jgi:hypothetical protein
LSFVEWLIIPCRTARLPLENPFLSFFVSVNRLPKPHDICLLTLPQAVGRILPGSHERHHSAYRFSIRAFSRVPGLKIQNDVMGEFHEDIGL